VIISQDPEYVAPAVEVLDDVVHTRWQPAESEDIVDALNAAGWALVNEEDFDRMWAACKAAQESP